MPDKYQYEPAEGWVVLVRQGHLAPLYVCKISDLFSGPQKREFADILVTALNKSGKYLEQDATRDS